MSRSNFIFRLISALWRALNGLRKVLHLLLLLFIFLIFLGVMSGEAPQLLPQEAVLRIQPAGSLVEQIAGDPYDRAVAELFGNEQPQTLLQDIVDALDYARDDDRIKAVHLELSSLWGSGLSKLQTLAVAIDDFRESGKPVIASADFFTQQAYYLAAHADEVYMHHQGIVFLQGYGAYRNYYKDAIDMLRIDWNVFRVGTHKSFVEPFTRMDMSPEDREARTRLISQFWNTYQDDVTAARGLADGAIDGYAQNMVEYGAAANGDVSQMALDRGLVDGLVGRAQLREILKEYAGADADDETDYAAVGMGRYLDHMSLVHGPRLQDDNVAVVVASGNIVDGSQPPGTIGGESTAALLRRALKDDSVKAVVLRVDSPGGSMFASEVITDEIVALQEAGKPVVASMSSVAASGGYWISVVADKVFASPSTVTGSIGIFGMFPTYQRTLEMVGVASDGVGTTPWSGALRPDREMPDEMKQLFQMVIEDNYDDFIARVAEHRQLEKDYVDSIAQGQVWSGRDALDKGLVDALGTFEDAIAAAAELAGIDEDAYGRKLIEKQLTPTEQMILDMLSIFRIAGIDPERLVDAPTPVERFANGLQKMLARIGQFNDPQGVYSHCFCTMD
jgi:protease-4